MKTKIIDFSKYSLEILMRMYNCISYFLNLSVQNQFELIEEINFHIEQQMLDAYLD